MRDMFFLPPCLERFLRLLFVLGLLLAQPAFAAGLSFSVPPAPAGVGQPFEVAVYLDSQGESINAISGSIRFSASQLTVVQVRQGGSVVSLWLEPPQSTAADVSFSGIIPGGYRGSQGYLFTLVFTAHVPGTVTLSSSAEQFLLNDGQGTAAPVTHASLQLQLAAQASPAAVPPPDTTPPEAFTIALARDPAVFDGQWFAAFTTQDKGVGVAAYEVAEAPGPPRAAANGLHWQPAQSPYLLHDQTRSSSLYVRAVDGAGNKRLAVLPASATPWYRQVWLRAILLFMSSLVLYLAWQWYARRFQRI